MVISRLFYRGGRFRGLWFFHNKEPALFAFSCFMVANLHRVCAFTEFFRNASRWTQLRMEQPPTVVAVDGRNPKPATHLWLKDNGGQRPMLWFLKSNSSPAISIDRNRDKKQNLQKPIWTIFTLSNFVKAKCLPPFVKKTTCVFWLIQHMLNCFAYSASFRRIRFQFVWGKLFMECWMIFTIFCQCNSTQSYGLCFQDIPKHSNELRCCAWASTCHAQLLGIVKFSDSPNLAYRTVWSKRIPAPMHEKDFCAQTISGPTSSLVFRIYFFAFGCASLISRFIRGRGTQNKGFVLLHSRHFAGFIERLDSSRHQERQAIWFFQENCFIHRLQSNRCIWRNNWLKF